jgi:hypothetical protein
MQNRNQTSKLRELEKNIALKFCVKRLPDS